MEWGKKKEADEIEIRKKEADNIEIRIKTNEKEI